MNKPYISFKTYETCVRLYILGIFVPLILIFSVLGTLIIRANAESTSSTVYSTRILVKHSRLPALDERFIFTATKSEPEVELEPEPVTLSGADLYKSYIFEIAERYENVEPELVISLVERESNFQPNATNYNGTCVGLMQISTKYHTARAHSLGVGDLRDPYGNLLTGIDLLSDLIEMADGDISYALMLYNMKTADAKALHAQGKTTSYVRTILARQEELKKEASSYA